MKDESVDRALNEARLPAGPDGARLDSTLEAMRGAMTPVRPMAPVAALAAAVFAVCALVAVAGAARAGFGGFARMAVWERVVLFGSLAALTWMSGVETVKSVIPGSRRRPAAAVPVLALAVLATEFTLLFREPTGAGFLKAGVICLAMGSVHAMAAAVLCVLVLRRGFAVEPAAAGVAGGTLAGLAGIALLELHCPNFEMAHVLVWHTAVLPLCVAAGVATAKVAGRR